VRSRERPPHGFLPLPPYHDPSQVSRSHGPAHPAGLRRSVAPFGLLRRPVRGPRRQPSLSKHGVGQGAQFTGSATVERKPGCGLSDSRLGFLSTAEAPCRTVPLVTTVVEREELHVAGHRAGRAVAALAAAIWLAAVVWTVYEVVMTRLSRVDNSWVFPTCLADGTLTFFMLAAAAPTTPRSWALRRRVQIIVVVVGPAVVGMALWARQAPLPELRPVAVPPANASPETVVRSFVEALDEHDTSTAAALCVRPDPPCQFLGYYVRFRITDLARPIRDPYDGFLPRGVVGEDIVGTVSGTARDGGEVGEDRFWTYVLAPLGPRGSWRIIDEGMG